MIWVSLIEIQMNYITGINNRMQQHDGLQYIVTHTHTHGLHTTISVYKICNTEYKFKLIPELISCIRSTANTIFLNILSSQQIFSIFLCRSQKFSLKPIPSRTFLNIWMHKTYTQNNNSLHIYIYVKIKLAMEENSFFICNFIILLIVE